jgi:hypothetical protein
MSESMHTLLRSTGSPIERDQCSLRVGAEEILDVLVQIFYAGVVSFFDEAGESDQSVTPHA